MSTIHLVCYLRNCVPKVVESPSIHEQRTNCEGRDLIYLSFKNINQSKTSIQKILHSYLKNLIHDTNIGVGRFIILGGGGGANVLV